MPGLRFKRAEGPTVETPTSTPIIPTHPSVAKQNILVPVTGNFNFKKTQYNQFLQQETGSKPNMGISDF